MQAAQTSAAPWPGADARRSQRGPAGQPAGPRVYPLRRMRRSLSVEMNSALRNGAQYGSGGQVTSFSTQRSLPSASLTHTTS